VRWISGLHLMWVLIAILAAYVIFTMFVADVGGTDDFIPHPTPTHSGAPTLPAD